MFFWEQIPQDFIKRDTLIFIKHKQNRSFLAVKKWGCHSWYQSISLSELGICRISRLKLRMLSGILRCVSVGF